MGLIGGGHYKIISEYPLHKIVRGVYFKKLCTVNRKNIKHSTWNAFLVYDYAVVFFSIEVDNTIRMNVLLYIQQAARRLIKGLLIKLFPHRDAMHS